MGAELQPAPALNAHSLAPDFASYAAKSAAPSLPNTRPPPVASRPPMPGSSYRVSQTTRPEPGSTATVFPHWSSPGIATKALPSHSFPFS